MISNLAHAAGFTITQSGISSRRLWCEIFQRLVNVQRARPSLRIALPTWFFQGANNE
jgi:hypothetical protein